MISFPDDPVNHNMGIASDGYYYYTVNGGNAASGLINVYDLQGNFISSNPILLDMRGIVYNPLDRFLYTSTYTGSAVYRILDVNSGTFEIVHSNILMNSQSSIGISWNGREFFDHYNGTVNVHDFQTGAILQTLTGFQYGAGNFGGNSTVTADPDYLYTWDANLLRVYVYDHNGNFIQSLTLTNGDCGMSLSFIDGKLFVSDDGNYNVGTWYGFSIRDPQTQDITITLTPVGLPIQIPANGGEFDFNIAATNNESYTTAFQFWTLATLPSGAQFGPIMNGFVNLTTGGSANRDRMQAVPMGAPTGDYTYDAYVGIYPNHIWDEDHFDFEKLATADNSGFFYEWTVSEGSSNSPASAVALLSDHNLLRAYPNPFNDTSCLEMHIPVSGNVRLSIYDITGREIATLVSGHSSLGRHSVVWDAEGMGSGVYFARLEAGGFSQTQKLLLIK